MFIFSQFNFPDPKPRVSEGDSEVPRGAGGGVGRDQLLSKSWVFPKADAREPKEGFGVEL